MRPGTHGRVKRRTEGFTIIEVMIVVAIVAILSLIAVPLYISHLTASKMSEGITGAGAIRTALRMYAAARQGLYPELSNATGDQLTLVGLTPGDLKGTYFSAEDYTVNSAAQSYTIRVTMPQNSNLWYQVDAAGNETKSY